VCCKLFCVMSVILCDVCYCIVLYCTVRYCVVFQCSTLPPRIDPFAVNNNNNNIIMRAYKEYIVS
jgi:hypothetical protein